MFFDSSGIDRPVQGANEFLQQLTLTVQGLVEDKPHRPHVAFAGVLLCFENLRGHVQWCSDCRLYHRILEVVDAFSEPEIYLMLLVGLPASL
jgi:hypothetical protein